MDHQADHDHSSYHTTINKDFSNMATLLKTIGVFSAAGEEDIEEYINRIRMVSHCATATDKDMAQAALLGLRGEAQAWATQYWETLVGLTFEQLAEELTSRFAKTRETAEVLTRFFGARQSATYPEYIGLLKDATLIFRRKCINLEALIKQVIVRSPGDIKSLLLQAAQNSPNWQSFVKSAEDAAWIAFPERIINECSIESDNSVERINYKNTKMKSSRKLYCKLHGECQHSTENCMTIKLVEQKGWKKESNNNVNLIKEDQLYIFSVNDKSINKK
ncbi:hypothetical protein ENBRE01_2410 [Enteropsectra breve]|nr:hypothetical protein ENBRE01_2410 [Enteropsectra breve]